MPSSLRRSDFGGNSIMEVKNEEAMEVQGNGKQYQANVKTEPGTNSNGNDKNAGNSVLPDGPGGDFVPRKSEDTKIFVGGISYDTTSDDLSNFFKQFGEVTKAEVKYDQMTERSRGFAFVEFAEPSTVSEVLKQKTREIKGKSVEVKPAKSRENKKIFVGGLPSEFPEEDLKNHFEKFGKVDDVEWPFDRHRGARRNFAFVVFEEESSADAAASELKQTFGDRTCDVKKATPQGRGRGGGGMGGYMQMGTRGRGRGRGSFGPGAGYGGIHQYGSLPPPGYNSNAAWGGGYGGGAWGDWYGSGAGGGGASEQYPNYYGSSNVSGYYDSYDYDPASLYAAYGAWQGWGNQGATAGAAGGAGYDAYSQGQTGGSGAAPGRGGRYQPY